MIARRLLAAARSFGADLAGIASIADLPPAEDVAWPDGALSLVVVAVAHPADKPELDWWFDRVDPPGNRVLAEVVRRSCDWAQSHLGVCAHHLPYHVERGGTYLKDAAVLAGLGCIGLNNLLLSPEYGPQVRLRAFTLDVELPSTGITRFDPCLTCAAPCRAACPQVAFVSRAPETGGRPVSPYLPARDGHFSRPACLVQMDLDVEAGAEQPAPGFDTPIKIIKYCRVCELACPVGRDYRSAPSQ